MCDMQTFVYVMHTAARRNMKHFFLIIFPPPYLSICTTTEWHVGFQVQSMTNECMCTRLHVCVLKVASDEKLQEELENNKAAASSKFI